MKIKLLDPVRFFEAEPFTFDPAMMGIQTKPDAGKVWRVQIIKEGLSLNGRYYSGKLLETVAQKFEGAKVFAYEFNPEFYDHLPEELTGQSFAKNLIGWLDRVALLETTDGKKALWGDFHVIDAGFQHKFAEAHAAGRMDLFGFSIDAEGAHGPKRLKEQMVDWVMTIDQVHSVDLVTLPAAGGKFMRLVTAVIREAEGTMNPRLIQFMRSNPDMLGVETLDGMSDQQVIGMIQETFKKMREGAAGGGDAAAQAAAAAAAADDKSGKADADKSGGKLKEGEQAAVLTKALDYIRKNDPNNAVDLLESLLREMLGAPAKTPADKKPVGDPAILAAALAAAGKSDPALQAQVTEALSIAKQIKCEAVLDKTLAGETNLPGPVVESIRKRFTGKIFESADLDTEIRSQKDIFGALQESGVLNAPQDEGTIVRGMITESDKMQAGLDLCLGMKPPEGAAGKAYEGLGRGFRSIREAYGKFTGDDQVRGVNHRVRRMMESGRIVEAKSSDFPYALGTSMTRRMIQAYATMNLNKLWEDLVIPTDPENFKTQERVRWGGFGYLSTVTEEVDYAYLTKYDEDKPTYTPDTKGNLFNITRKSILNDDMNFFRTLPTMLARAAARTLARFVFDLIIGYGGTTPTINGATIYDGKALYHADHSNLGALALAYDPLSTAKQAVWNQPELSSGEVLGLALKVLLLPIELQSTADSLINSENKPGGSNNDKNTHYKTVEPRYIPFLRGDTSNWYGVVDPNDCPGVEIGFVQGQREPEILVQDSGQIGDVFKADKITYKVRHEYGGGILDYRAFYGAIVG